MAYPGYGGMPGMPGQGMPQHGMPIGHMGGPMPGSMGGPMPGSMGGPMGGAPPQGGYGPYGGGYPSGYGAAPAANDPMWGYFTAIAGQDGEVDAEELQRCLTQAGFTGTYSPFSLDTCRIMIAMLDRDFTGKMGFNEFKELFTALNGWKQNFMMFDQDRSGSIEPHEMTQAFGAMVCETLGPVGVNVSENGGVSPVMDWHPVQAKTQPLNQCQLELAPASSDPWLISSVANGYRISPQALNAIIKRYNKGGRIYFDDYVACSVKLRAVSDNFRRRDTMQQGSVTFQYDDFIQCTMSI